MTLHELLNRLAATVPDFAKTLRYRHPRQNDPKCGAPAVPVGEVTS